jgi:Holliday junction resolvase
VNSRAKGARGERQWRDELRANGYAARRGQQFSGSPDSPDVVCDSLPWIHFEVKAVERLNIEDAMDQARRDAGVKVPVVAHRRSFRPWLVTMNAETFFRFLRGELASQARLETDAPVETSALRNEVTDGNGGIGERPQPNETKGMDGTNGQSQMANGKAGCPEPWTQRRD